MNKYMSEADIQHQCVMWLEYSGFLVYQFAPAKTHKRLMGTVPTGWVDMLVFSDKRMWLFELKAHAGKVSPEQKKVHDDLSKEGFEVYVVRSLDEVKTIVNG